MNMIIIVIIISSSSHIVTIQHARRLARHAENVVNNTMQTVPNVTYTDTTRSDDAATIVTVTPESRDLISRYPFNPELIYQN